MFFLLLCFLTNRRASARMPRALTNFCLKFHEALSIRHCRICQWIESERHRRLILVFRTVHIRLTELGRRWGPSLPSPSQTANVCVCITALLYYIVLYMIAKYLEGLRYSRIQVCFAISLISYEIIEISFSCTHDIRKGNNGNEKNVAAMLLLLTWAHAHASVHGP